MIKSCLNQERNLHRSKQHLQTKTALNKCVGGFWCKGQLEMDFFTGGSVIMDLYFGQKRLFKVKILFLTNTQLLTSHDVNWWTGVEWFYLWIIVMFLSAVWTLILTAPIHCRGSIAEQVMECYIFPNLKNNKHIYIWITWRWVNFQQLFIFGCIFL